MGNKGAIGVSIKIASTTLLFVNAHLAGKLIFPGFQSSRMPDTNVAHEGKLPNRLANMAKIKVCSLHFSQWSRILTKFCAERVGGRRLPRSGRSTDGSRRSNAPCLVHRVICSSCHLQISPIASTLHFFLVTSTSVSTCRAYTQTGSYLVAVRLLTFPHLLFCTQTPFSRICTSTCL